MAEFMKNDGRWEVGSAEDIPAVEQIPCGAEPTGVRETPATTVGMATGLAGLIILPRSSSLTSLWCLQLPHRYALASGREKSPDSLQERREIDAKNTRRPHAEGVATPSRLYCLHPIVYLHDSLRDNEVRVATPRDSIF